MSRAFVKETDDVPELPDRAVSEHPNLVTARGLKLIAQNYRCRSGELDLVLLDQGVLTVVEVRLRRSLKFGGASVSIDHEKRRRIIQATRHLLLTRRELRHLPRLCRGGLGRSPSPDSTGRRNHPRLLRLARAQQPPVLPDQGHGRARRALPNCRA